MALPYTLEVADENASTEKSNRARGRPRRADAPIVPWDEVDRLLVFGEKVKDETTGREGASFPSYTELATRYGVSKSRIWQYAKRAKCLRRREESREREQARYEQKVVERRAEARALGTDDVVRIIDGYIEGFRKAVDDGKVRFDSPADLDRLVRLKELMLGNADSVGREPVDLPAQGTAGARAENGRSPPGGAAALAPSRATFAHVAPGRAAAALAPSARSFAPVGALDAPAIASGARSACGGGKRQSAFARRASSTRPSAQNSVARCEPPLLLEIQNPVQLHRNKWQTPPREVVVDPGVHGGPTYEHLDFYDVQMKRVVELAEVLCGRFGIPRMLPLGAGGDVLRGLAPPDFRGVCGHYHVSRSKPDPGLTLWPGLQTAFREPPTTNETRGSAVA